MLGGIRVQTMTRSHFTGTLPFLVALLITGCSHAPARTDQMSGVWKAPSGNILSVSDEGIEIYNSDHPQMSIETIKAKSINPDVTDLIGYAKFFIPDNNAWSKGRFIYARLEKTPNTGKHSGVKFTLHGCYYKSREKISSNLNWSELQLEACGILCNDKHTLSVTFQENYSSQINSQNSLPVPDSLTGWWEPLGDAAASTYLHISKTGDVQMAFLKNPAQPFNPQKNAEYRESYPLHIFYLEKDTLYGIERYPMTPGGIPNGKYGYHYIKIYTKPRAKDLEGTVLVYRSNMCPVSEKDLHEPNNFHWKRYNEKECQAAASYVHFIR